MDVLLDFWIYCPLALLALLILPLSVFYYQKLNSRSLAALHSKYLRPAERTFKPVPPEGYSNFEELVRIIKRDENIDDYLLQPDGKFQKVPVTLKYLYDTVAKLVEDELPEKCPRVILSSGVCRVGSTALSNIFGLAGYPAFYQPLKCMYRWVFQDKPVGWKLEFPECDVIHIKETVGPWTIPEICFNPLRVLLDAGVPAEKITLVALGRDPKEVLSSWLDHATDNLEPVPIFQNCILATLNSHRVLRHAEKHGVKIVHFAYEMSKQPKEAVKKLFHVLDLPCPEDVTENWNEKGNLMSNQSCIIWPKEPRMFDRPRCHASHLEYMFRPRDTSSLTAEHLDLLETTGILQMYDENVKKCYEQLNIENINRLNQPPNLSAAHPAEPTEEEMQILMPNVLIMEFLNTATSIMVNLHVMMQKIVAIGRIPSR